MLEALGRSPELGRGGRAEGASEPHPAWALRAGATPVRDPTLPGHPRHVERELRLRPAKGCGPGGGRAAEARGLGSGIREKSPARAPERTNSGTPLLWSLVPSPKSEGDRAGGKGIRLRSVLVNFLFNVTGPHCGSRKHVTRAINLR